MANMTVKPVRRDAAMRKDGSEECECKCGSEPFEASRESYMASTPLGNKISDQLSKGAGRESRTNSGMITPIAAPSSKPVPIVDS